MLDIKFIRENPNLVYQGAKSKKVDLDIGFLLSLDQRRRELIAEVDSLRMEQNKITEEIAKEKDKEKKEAKIVSMQKLKSEREKLESEQEKVENQFDLMMRQVPNLPFEDVPFGEDSRNNIILRSVGKRDFKFQPKSYLELARNLDLIDTERAAKVSGSRFGYLKRRAALLEFALVQMILDFVTNESKIKKIINERQLKISSKPFIPIVPPVMIKPEMMKAMGYADKNIEEIYHLEKDNMYLVGTSEQSIGPMHANEIFESEDLPLRYISFSTCFRREAGSYGKDTKGILRVHQFDKLEMFVFCLPGDSREEHEFLLAIEEKIMQDLGIPYRVALLCSGDLGIPSAKTYDIEAWLPGQNEGKGEYRETHSTSNTTDFQTRRLNIKYRIKKDGKKNTEYIHALNGTAAAIGRMIIAILENYQEEDGSIVIPEILRNYAGGSAMI